jgi:hypothetical protein
MQNNGFHEFILPLEHNLFEQLAQSVDFEAITKGRKGIHLVRPDEAGIPIVRTTTKYDEPARNFAPIHDFIVDTIKNQMPEISLHFNNALMEIYDNSYTKMKYHSDQSLDLADNSYIALFSCYAQPQNTNLRTLKIQHKTTNQEFEIALQHNSVILFPLSVNSNFLHKIILPTIPKNSDNKWLGLTFRQSKTYIQFKNNLAHFSNGDVLTLADEHQSKAFYMLRGEENNSIHFTYPDIKYTLSPSDLLPPACNL